MSKIEKGKVVEIEYTLTLDDGEVADATEGTPMPYLHGSEAIIEGLQAALDGRKEGESFSVRLSAEQGFGAYDDELIEEVAREDLPDDIEVGQELVAETEDGEELLAYVGEIEGDTAYLDFNHPLAGEALTYEVKIVRVRDATAEELERGDVDLPDVPLAG